jgi:hypothetical protein
MTTYTVILDACVMYPAPLRSYLLYLAQTGLYRAKWTEQIHDEWIRNLIHNQPHLNVEKLQKTRELMNSHAPDCVVEGYQQFVAGIELPDNDDRHVVAAAIKGQAEGIITFNLKDFPHQSLASLGLTAIHPDEFLTDMFELDPSQVILAAQRQRRSLRNPPMTVEAYLDSLQRQKLPMFVSKLRQFAMML